MVLRKRAKKEVEIPTASMADIAFLLIVFFMLTTVFSQETGLKYELPDSTEEVSLEKENLNILIQPNGAITINEMPADYNQIMTQVKSKKLVNPKVFVVIKVEPETPYKYLIDTIDAVLQGGVDNVAFQSTEESLEDFNKEFQMPQ